MKKSQPKSLKPTLIDSKANQRRPPLVLVEGFLGDPGLECWRHLINCQAKREGEPRLILSVQLGSLSSVHDRTCEIFYQIKGGRVDYGEEHARECGHERFGKTYPGLYPEWSEDNPVHFLGHSFGGLTIWALQQKLAQKEFTNHPTTNDRWCRSVTCFSSPLRGTPATYVLGCQEQTMGKIRQCSVGAWIYRLCYVYCWLNLASLKTKVYDLYMDHWQLWQHSMGDVLYNFFWGNQFDHGKDNAATDLTVEMAEKFNLSATTFKSTYYRSYAASMTTKDPKTDYHRVMSSCSRGVCLNNLSNQLGCYEFKDLALNSSEWHENDGIIPTISQFHPGPCRPGYCTHRQFTKRDLTIQGFSEKPEPGKWQVTYLPCVSHFDVVRCKAQVLPEHCAVILKDYWNWIEQIDRTKARKRPLSNIITPSLLKAALTEAKRLSSPGLAVGTPTTPTMRLDLPPLKSPIPCP